METSAFGVDDARISKALGDTSGVRGAVSGTYDAAKAGKPVNVARIKNKLAPLKEAMVAAAKK